MKKSVTLNENVLEFLTANSISIETTKNNVFYKKITDELASKISLYHICAINYKIHLYLLQIMQAMVIKEIPRIILMDKIDSRLPYYKAYMKFLVGYDCLLSRPDFNYYISNATTYETFPNDEAGKKCSANVAKFYSIVGETAIEFVMKRKNDVDTSNLFNATKTIYKCSNENDDIQIKNRKLMLLKFAEILQEIIDNFGGKFKLKEIWQMLKDCEKDLEGKTDLVPFKLEFKGFADIPLFNKIKVFDQLVSACVNCLEFGDYYPSICSAYRKFYCDNTMVKTFTELISIIQERLVKENEFEKVKSIINNILSYAMSSFEENFPIFCSLEPLEKYEKFEESCQVIKNFFGSNCDNRLTNYNDPLPLLKVIITILGELTVQENPEKTKNIINQIFNIMLEMKENYFGFGNIPYVSIILERLLLFYDKKQNLQKMNLELKIKEAFYDVFLTQPKTSLKVEEFNLMQDITHQFNLNGKIFYEVFNHICELSEDKTSIRLKEGIGIYYYLYFI